MTNVLPPGAKVLKLRPKTDMLKAKEKMMGRKFLWGIKALKSTFIYWRRGKPYSCPRKDS